MSISPFKKNKHVIKPMIFLSLSFFFFFKKKKKGTMLFKIKLQKMNTLISRSLLGFGAKLLFLLFNEKRVISGIMRPSDLLTND
jgi:hypothetical protein